ncbi:unnamed protein product [Larinioides sclopetarius]|uniref:Uncharacterized protein n=1 Tax=Larinioides sclopetarius TaxID=280406 RepID=A0AAV2BZ80_9ARAC
MWLFFLSSLAIAHGALAEVDCSKSAYDGCVTPTLFTYIPTDLSEFNRLCPQLPAFQRCLKDFQDECGSESSSVFKSEEEYNGKYGAYNEVCESGTFLNRVATENLRCFNQTFQTTSCPEKVKSVTGPFRSPPQADKDYTLPIEIMCLQDILESNCMAADFGKNCGSEASEATLQFLRRIFYVYNTCGKNIAETLKRGLEFFNLDEEQKAVVTAALDNIISSATE